MSKSRQTRTHEQTRRDGKRATKQRDQQRRAARRAKHTTQGRAAR